MLQDEFRKGDPKFIVDSQDRAAVNGIIDVIGKIKTLMQKYFGKKILCLN